MTRHQGINALVLIGLISALFMNWTWPWGLLFLYWTLPACYSGETFLVGTLHRKDEPLLFWLVVVLWISLGLLMILLDAAPSLIPYN